MRGPLEPRYRHYHQYLHTERLEDYRLGGYHPVNIGDRLDGNRYIIVNKLGHGDTCTVWIATDTEYGGYVALSILQARCTSEEEIDGIEQLQRLKDGGDDDIRGVSNLLLPLRFFETCGPNGTHICIVFTVQGQSVSVATKRHLGLASQVLPFQRAKSVMLDVANGLVYAHKSRLVHGDLHPGQLLLGMAEFEPRILENLGTTCDPTLIAATHKTDSVSLGINCPKFLIEGVFARDMDVSIFSGPTKLSDFGDAFFMTNPPNRISDRGPYMSPEYCLPGHISPAADVWAFGCIVFQLLSGRDLFGAPDDLAEKIVTDMMNALGKPPDFISEAWRLDIGVSFSVVDSPARPLAHQV